jgi:peroxiredoxin
MSTHDPYTLPPDLPVPEDDGAASHLTGMRIPRLELPTTDQRALDLAEAAQQLLVLYIYPRTGKPGDALPTGWDEIPGARGCTPQACAFRDLHAEIAATGAHTLGLSAQSVAEQHEVVERLQLPYALASDPLLTVAQALELPTFEVDGMRLYKRLTLIAERGEILKVFYPVFPPNRNAAEVLEWLQANR